MARIFNRKTTSKVAMKFNEAINRDNEKFSKDQLNLQSAQMSLIDNKKLNSSPCKTMRVE